MQKAEIKLCWPRELKHLAPERDTRVGMISGHRSQWPLDIAGPFCFWPRMQCNSRNFNLNRVAGMLSNLLALPIRKDHKGFVECFRVELPDYEWDRVRLVEYRKSKDRKFFIAKKGR